MRYRLTLEKQGTVALLKQTVRAVSCSSRRVASRRVVVCRLSNVAAYRRALRVQLSKLSGIAPTQMVVADVYMSRIHADLEDDTPLTNISHRDDIYVYEILPPSRRIGAKPSGTASTATSAVTSVAEASTSSLAASSHESDMHVDGTPSTTATAAATSLPAADAATTVNAVDVATPADGTSSTASTAPATPIADGTLGSILVRGVAHRTTNCEYVGLAGGEPRADGVILLGPPLPLDPPPIAQPVTHIAVSFRVANSKFRVFADGRRCGHAG